MRVNEPAVPPIVTAAWDAYGDHREVVEVRELSANVSTNSVHMLILDDGHNVVAKRSSYGSYVHFRQDHYRIHEWIHRLRGTRYAAFLAPVLVKNGEVFTYREEGEWVVFYGQQPFYDFLPKVLSDRQIESFAEEMALFHRECLDISDRVRPTWQSLGADVASLHDAIGSVEWRNERGFSNSSVGFVRAHCDAFLGNADDLGYHEWTKIPVLIDWNLGNFSVGFDGEGFKFFSRWDYDWFRIEPRMLDLYFCARVVRAEGDQETFSYTVDPLFEERFMKFLRTYHRILPLKKEELLFLKEAYRFFILNYVLRVGEHFFQPDICHRLQQEAIEDNLPQLELVSFEPLLDVLLNRKPHCDPDRGSRVGLGGDRLRNVSRDDPRCLDHQISRFGERIA